MNMLLAVAVLTGLFMVRFPKIPSSPSPEIGYIVPDSAAAKAGIAGRRPHRTNRRHGQSHLGRHRDEGSDQRGPSSERLDRPRWRTQAGYRNSHARSKTGTGFAGWGGQSDIEIARRTVGLARRQGRSRRRATSWSASTASPSTPRLRFTTSSTAMAASRWMWFIRETDKPGTAHFGAHDDGKTTGRKSG